MHVDFVLGNNFIFFNFGIFKIGISLLKSINLFNGSNFDSTEIDSFSIYDNNLPL